MKSFTETVSTPYKFKTLVKESLNKRAGIVLSSPEVMTAASLGLLEFEDHPDQQHDALTHDEIYDILNSHITRYLDKGVTFDVTNDEKRVNPADTHAEDEDEELDHFFKHVVGHDILETPNLKESLQESFRANMSVIAENFGIENKKRG